MRLALSQYDIPRDPQKSLEYLQGEALRLAPMQPDLWALPEFCLTGYGNPPSKIAVDEDGSQISSMRELAAVVGCPIVGAFAVREEGSYFNRLLVIDSDGILARYDKQRLFSYWGEDTQYVTGTRSCRVRIGPAEVGCFICYDLRFPELFREVAGAELMLVSANWPSSRVGHWTALLKARAIENQCYVLGVNRIGSRGDISFPGCSVVYNHLGESLVELADLQASPIVTLDLDSLCRYREDFPVLRDAQLTPTPEFHEGL